MSDEPTKLFTIVEVAAALGATRSWVRHHEYRGAPPADFIAGNGSRQMRLWTARSLDRWRAYQASGESVRPESFSDHNAVNNVGNLKVTWKLWWRNTHDGGAMWWFSTPRGWYVSNDDGRTWDDADVMVRPGDYRYFCVNGSVNPQRHVASVLRSAERLRRELEGQKCSSE